MNLKALKDTPPWDWPKEASQTFLDILRDDRAVGSDRLLAAELAGDFTVINDELVDALLSILRKDNESEKLRGKAAISLGPVLEYADTAGFEDADDVPIAEETFRRIQELLRRLYRDGDVPKEVRRRILEASVRAPQDWHADAVRAAYATDDPAWQLTAVFCMRFIHGFDETIQLFDKLGLPRGLRGLYFAKRHGIDTGPRHLNHPIDLLVSVGLGQIRLKEILLE